jgi:post-segregation antitoxin (ccd killing protein)
MRKVSVYLPDGLYRQAREQRLPITKVARQAVEAALRRRRTDEWINRVRARPPRVQGRIDALAAIDAARDEFGTGCP